MKQLIKKAPLFASMLLLTGNVAISQETDSKMSNYIGISYGPSVASSLTSLTTTNSDLDQFDFNRVMKSGALNLQYDHLLSRSFSLGIDFYYLQKKSTGTVTEYNTGVQSDAKYIVNRFKTQVRLAYHFPVKNPNVDVYVGGGIGINNQSRKLVVNGTETSRNEYPSNFLFPVSLRTYAGLRYSFTKHFGMNAELGIGGPIFTGGFHVRF